MWPDVPRHLGSPNITCVFDFGLDVAGVGVGGGGPRVKHTSLSRAASVLRVFDFGRDMLGIGVR